MLYTEILPDDTDQPGITKQQFETAVSVWTWMQPGNEAPTVAATAASFNTTPEIVRQCVRESEWMFLDGPDDDPTRQRVETREAGEQQSPPTALSIGPTAQTAAIAVRPLRAFRLAAWSGRRRARPETSTPTRARTA